MLPLVSGVVGLHCVTGELELLTTLCKCFRLEDSIIVVLQTCLHASFGPVNLIARAGIYSH